MFLHIGDNISIPKSEIVAILDRDTVENSLETKVFIDKLIEEGCLINPSNLKVNSYIITCVKNIDRRSRKKFLKYNLYISSISSKALSERKNKII